LRELLSLRLRSSGFEVLAAEDGGRALHLWRTARPPPPAVVVTDWAMPNLDGIELARRIRADPRAGAVPIILFTASPPPDDLATLKLHYQSKTTAWADIERLIVELIASQPASFAPSPRRTLARHQPASSPKPVRTWHTPKEHSWRADGIDSPALDGRVSAGQAPTI
jgi:CheY-like chemotaxis protein